MSFFRSERGIGRGEVAESQLEVPLFAGFMVLCCVGLVLQHMVLGNQNLTAALSISMLVFGGTVLRVEVGLFVLLAAMLLSPEIELRPGSGGDRNVNIRYGDILVIVIFMLIVMYGMSIATGVANENSTVITAGLAEGDVIFLNVPKGAEEKELNKLVNK